jgi:hypothetical protein
MLGKPEWFQRRKYSGWGICPKTWQGWLYLAAIVAPVFIIPSIPWWGDSTGVIILFVWGILIGVDLIDIMVRMPRDERERLHEAIAERNALWVVIVVLAAGVAYRAAAGAVAGRVEIDPVIIIALVGGLLVKAATNIYLDRKN